jgi:mRNA interferase HicA
MMRADLLRHLRDHGCRLLREGARHSVIVNLAAGVSAIPPAHREPNYYLARKMCPDLEVPEPR